MSKQFLSNLLQETIKELRKPANQPGGLGFRELDSDIKVHRVSASVNGVKNQVYIQLQELGIPPRQINHPRMTSVIDTYVPNFVAAIYNSAKKKFDKNPSSSNTRVRGNKSAWSVTILEGGYGYSLSRREVGHLSVFETISTLYSSQKKTLVNNINKALKDLATMKEGEYRVNSGNFLDFGHRSGSAVVEQQTQRARDSFQSGIKTNNEKSSDQITDKDLKNLGLKVFFRKKGTLERDTLEVGIEAAKINRGKKSELELKSNLIKQLENAIKKLDTSKSFAKRPGSDTRVKTESKKIIKTFDEGIVRRKNVKVKSKDFKPSLSNNSVSKTLKSKAKNSTSKRAKLSHLGLKKVELKTGSASSTIALAALINQKLPKTVRGNMGVPGLQNRTGRFANSVRVTDVSTTSQGFPSIGYIYDKNPYQIFEPGAGKSPWATPDRDPRKIIDRSIREIAAELLTGRFYTRRV